MVSLLAIYELKIHDGLANRQLRRTHVVMSGRGTDKD